MDPLHKVDRSSHPSITNIILHIWGICNEKWYLRYGPSTEADADADDDGQQIFERSLDIGIHYFAWRDRL
jgi:hypothetical protein